MLVSYFKMFEPGNTDTDTFLLFDESNKNSTQSELNLLTSHHQQNHIILKISTFLINNQRNDVIIMQQSKICMNH